MNATEELMQNYIWVREKLGIFFRNPVGTLLCQIECLFEIKEVCTKFDLNANCVQRQNLWFFF